MDKELAKYPYQAEAGFRFVGTRVFVPTSSSGEGSYVNAGKKELQGVPPEGSLDILRAFFENGLPQQVDSLSSNCPVCHSTHVYWENCQEIRKTVIKEFRAKLAILIGAFERQHHFAFTAASLLLAYDGGGGSSRESANAHEGGTCGVARVHPASDMKCPRVELFLIDLAHVRVPGYIAGGPTFFRGGAVDSGTLFGLLRLQALLGRLSFELSGSRV